MKIFDQSVLDELTRQARENPRRRKNLNIHPTDESRCHRLFNVVEPDSYIPPHRHLDPEKGETFLVVRGRLGVVAFSDDGTIAEHLLLASGGEAVAIDIPAGVYHTVVSLQEGSLFFEAKGGPYLPLSEEEKAPWAPGDGAPEGASYLAALKRRFSSP